MHPIQHAKDKPDHVAVIMAGSGDHLTYGELDAQANRFAQLLRSSGFQHGDVIAAYLENRIEYFPMFWGAQRSGVTLVPVSSHLTAAETAYILGDSGAKMIVTSTRFAAMIGDLRAQSPDIRFLIFDSGGEDDAAAAIAAQPAQPIDDQSAGVVMLYSSGTTGRPKGIRPAPPADPGVQAMPPLALVMTHMMGVPADGSCVYLAPGPLYHAAPLIWATTVHRLGGTVVVMEKFEPEGALAAMEQYEVDTTQWVPTHFVRMLKLPQDVRSNYDLSAHKRAIHAAAPCPPDVKRAMIEWWGPIILEYYAGSEGNGMTMVGSEDWLTHPGTVGRPIFGELHICDANGDDVPAGETGLIHFASEQKFAYHNDPEKTQEATNRHGWTTLGDIGRVDEDGFLYLTDRKSHMIISGGVNIYPQEIENLLIAHDKVQDAAVIGAPDPDMGERVVAVVQPLDMTKAGDALAQELTDYLASKLARLKIPRQIDFRAELPREANGKLYKRKLRDEYAT
ncbi:acyl-CoA synthetase [Altererythrobacter aquiaggeris]|uniref:acyl-CoA synthetase n=1 Tax=Aestuarierythrobacter aquiaggeris TaxID=1898396 RepID=UPI00301890E8